MQRSSWARLSSGALLFFMGSMAMAADYQTIPIERLSGSPGLSGPTPREVKFSPDGSRVTYLKARTDDRQRFDLWSFDVQTGASSMLVDSTLLDPDEGKLSEEELALRERKRIAGSKGIVEYGWDDQGQRILVPLGGDLWLVKLEGGKAKPMRLTKTEAFEYDAKISPNGRYVSFIRDGGVYAIDLSNKREWRVSPAPDAKNAVSYGVAEFVAQEEMRRFSGHFWSPDDKHLAFTRVDESGVDIIPRFEIGADGTAVVEQRYPRAGRPNAKVELYVYDTASGKTVKSGLQASPDVYMARVDWAGPNALFLQRVNRKQTRIELMKVDLKSGALTPAFVEEQAHWVNLSDDFTALKDGHILWTTERTGYRHVIMLDANGLSPKPVTSGNWAVDNIVGVDEAKREVYFLANKDTPVRFGLYKANYETPGEPVRVTPESADWKATMPKNAATAFVGVSSTMKQPSQVGLYRVDGSRVTWILENALNESHPYYPYLKAHQVPEIGTLRASDGQTLYWSMLKPPGFDASKRYPVLVSVYGGPTAQDVREAWVQPGDEFFAQQGMIVFQLDNRGTGNRGKRFEDVIHRDLGNAEVEDQLAGVAMLKKLPYVDGDRIAIEGWSYGGYMALLTTLKAPAGTFAAAMVGAPVSDWALYDTFYTERYMGTPQDNAKGYKSGSVFPYIDNLKTTKVPLLMMHGMADDNVTFDNSTRVYAELQEKSIPFEMMTYPGQRHGVRDPAKQLHLNKTKLDFLRRYLKLTPEHSGS